MIRIRRSADRGRANFGWLDSRHTFSFGGYHDPAHMGFGPLRVINEDQVIGGAGFPAHPHRDMEIISYVLAGALEHRDSTGGGSVIRPGDVQRMSAGSGIVHSEFNASRDEPVHFLQIWIMPDRQGVTPGYEQKTFSVEDRANRLRLVAAADGREGALTIHQDADVYASALAAGREVAHHLRPGRLAWIQMARGEAIVAGQTLQQGDGAAIANVADIAIQGGGAGAELILFDMTADTRKERSI